MKANDNQQKISLAVVGGCHVAGWTLKPGELSFVDILQQNLPVVKIIKKSSFKLENIRLIEHLITHTHTNYILLQLGNNEFSVSYRTIFHLSSSFMQNEQTNKTDIPFAGDADSIIIKFIKYTLLPIRWIYGINRNKEYLNTLCSIIKKYPDKNFIILSPFPMYDQNYPRRKAGLFYKRLFAKLPNVEFIDSFRVVPSKKEYFNDKIHLNARGHQLLGDFISKRISNYIVSRVNILLSSVIFVFS
jgi:lysophospholipase L1-like esterase